MRRVGGTTEGRNRKWGEVLLCQMVSGMKGKLVVNISINKTKRGQNAANLGANRRKRRKDEAQGTKGKSQRQEAQNTRRGGNMCVHIYIYISNIYKEEKYMDINQGVMYLTLGVIPTFLET